MVESVPIPTYIGAHADMTQPAQRAWQSHALYLLGLPPGCAARWGVGNLDLVCGNPDDLPVSPDGHGQTGQTMLPDGFVGPGGKRLVDQCSIGKDSSNALGTSILHAYAPWIRSHVGRSAILAVLVPAPAAISRGGGVCELSYIRHVAASG